MAPACCQPNLPLTLHTPATPLTLHSPAQLSPFGCWNGLLVHVTPASAPAGLTAWDLFLPHLFSANPFSPVSDQTRPAAGLLLQQGSFPLAH